jgi:hypothetical protein
LFIADSEINELSVFNGNNIFEVSLTGDTVYGQYASNNKEPTGLTYNEFDGYFYIVNDDNLQLCRYDNQLNRTLACVKTNVATPNAYDPEGLTSDPQTGFLYVSDAISGGKQVLVYNSQLQFQYRFSAPQPRDGEGIAFDPVSRHLFILSGLENAIYEYTTSGTFVQSYDIRGFNPTPTAAQGISFGPTSDPNDSPSRLAVYIADGMRDNFADGRIYEAILGTAAANQAPVVNAGPNQTISLPAGAALDGTVTDDGLPSNPGAVTTTWTKVSGPGTVSFANVAAIDTTATFSEVGSYVLRLSAGDGQLTAADDVAITVNATVGGAVAIAFQDGVSPTASYAGTQDTKIQVTQPTSVRGSSTTLEVDGSPDDATLIRWDLRTIPPGSSVQTASLTFNVVNGSNHTYEIYEVRRNWVEAAATWNVLAAGQNWQVAGAQGASDRGSTVLGTVTGLTGLRTFTLNAAGIALVQAWVDNPATNFGVIIQDYLAATNGIDFSSSEFATTSSRPRLDVTYSGASAASGSAPAAIASGVGVLIGERSHEPDPPGRVSVEADKSADRRPHRLNGMARHFLRDTFSGVNIGRPNTAHPARLDEALLGISTIAELTDAVLAFLI